MGTSDKSQSTSVSSALTDNGDADGEKEPYVHGSEFALWEKYQQIAMHFNDLIMRLRTQALGGLTGVIAISGVVINLTAKTESRMEWEILFGTIVFFMVAWTALWALDWFYYTRLLLGAVDAIVEHEKRTPQLNGPHSATRINISSVLRGKVPRYAIPINFFYLVVFVALLVGGGYAFSQLSNATPSQAQRMEYTINILAEKPLQLKVEPKSAVPPVRDSPDTLIEKTAPRRK
jgi:hypothetical protein